MRILLEHKWEKLDEYTARAKVLGGWIVQMVAYSLDQEIVAMTSVFIKDGEYGWGIKQPEPEFVEIEAQKPSFDQD